MTRSAGKVTFSESATENLNNKSGASSQAPLVQRRKELEKLLGIDLPDFPEQLPGAADGDAADACALRHQPFTGLTNLGATCYMNSLLQALFTTPELREHVITFPFEQKQRHARNVGYHLQLLFSRMQDVGIRNHCSTKELMDSFGMGGEAHREQHDVQELNRVLMDVLQEFIDRLLCDAPPGGGVARQKQVIHDLYRGQLNDVMCCTHCHHTRTSQSPFLDVVLPLCSMLGEAYDEEANIHVHSLEDCLDRYVAREVIDGVDCSACQGRHPLEKFQQFSQESLPKVMTMQLLRLQYNIETGRRDKVLKDIRLPLELDMSTWCGSRQGDGEGVVVEPQYRLHAIICHRGTAYHGHYYAFVRCYPSGVASEGAMWYKLSWYNLSSMTRR